MQLMLFLCATRSAIEITIHQLESVKWPDGDTTPEGTEIEDLFTSLGLTQVISEPTNFEPNKNVLILS